jgi:hypothetical protein
LTICLPPGQNRTKIATALAAELKANHVELRALRDL